MHPQTIFAKTPKGVLEVKNRTLRLARDFGLVFLAVDGKTPVADLPQKARVDDTVLPLALDRLLADGYIQVFHRPPAARRGKAISGADLDLDFTSSAAVARLNAEARARAEIEQQARDTAAARDAAEARIRSMEHALKVAEAAREDALDRAQQAARALERDGILDRRITDVNFKQVIKWACTAMIGAMIAAVLGIGLLHIVPLPGYVGGAEKLLSERLQEPVSLDSVRFTLFPAPQLRLKRIAIGSQQDLKIETAIVPLSLAMIFEDRMDFDEVELLSVSIEEGMVPRLAAWAQPPAGAAGLRIGRLKSHAVKLALRGIDLPNFEATVAFGKNGGMQKMLLRDAKVNLELTVLKNGELRANFIAKNWRFPLGPALEFTDLAGAAAITGGHIAVSGIDGVLYGGALKGAVTIRWGNPLAVEGEFSLKGSDIGQLLPAFTREFGAHGVLDMNAKFALQGQSRDGLFAAPRVAARFTLLNGALDNVDLLRSFQSAGRVARDGGNTSFNVLTGDAQAVANRVSFRNLELISAPLDCTGAIDVSPAGELSGRLSLISGSQTVTVARGTLNVRGSIKNPRLSP